MISFGIWDNEIHFDFEQVKRIQAAVKLPTDGVVSISSGSSPEMVYQGSSLEPYRCTLDTCSCTDFSFRGKPCKHIYFLAIQSGGLSADDLPVYKKKKSQYDASADISRYQNLYMSGDISADLYVKLCSLLSKLKK